MGAHSRTNDSPGRIRRYLGITGGVTVAVVLISSVAGASSTTSEGIVSVTPKNLTTGASVAAGKSVIYVVSGGWTTVPTDATRVQFAVTVSKQQKPGSLTSPPYLDAADASGDSLTWAAPNTTTSGTILEPVGVANKVTFTNTTTGSLTVAIKITGYSTSARLAARLDTVESDVSAVQGDVSGLQADVRGLQADVNTAEANIADLQSVNAAARHGWISSGQSLVAGDNYIMVTPAFTAPRLVTCYVTSSVQVNLATAAPIGAGAAVYLRNAKLDNGTNSNDGAYGHYLTSLGVSGNQPDITRSSTFTISAGHSVQFGVFIGNASAPWAGSTAYVSTSFDCR